MTTEKEGKRNWFAKLVSLSEAPKLAPPPPPRDEGRIDLGEGHFKNIQAMMNARTQIVSDAPIFAGPAGKEPAATSVRAKEAPCSSGSRSSTPPATRSTDTGDSQKTS